MEPYRFTQQSDQFTGECLPCTKAQFYTIVNSASVNNTIGTGLDWGAYPTMRKVIFGLNLTF